MKKLAILLIGDRYTGKSTTLIKYVKPKFGIREKAHIFSYNGYEGYIKTQSLQEANHTLQTLEKFQKYDVFVLASWPNAMGTPTLEKISNKLKKLGFERIKQFPISKCKESEEKALGKEIVETIHNHLKLPRSSSH